MFRVAHPLQSPITLLPLEPRTSHPLEYRLLAHHLVDKGFPHLGVTLEVVAPRHTVDMVVRETEGLDDVTVDLLGECSPVNVVWVHAVGLSEYGVCRKGARLGCPFTCERMLFTRQSVFCTLKLMVESVFSC